MNKDKYCISPEGNWWSGILCIFNAIM
jgi:hypothetical protein